MLGRLLFIAQILALLACAWPMAWHWPLPLTNLLLLSNSLWVMWVLWHNRLGNWSVLPEPLNEAKLITTGPYGLMRHPMYSAVLLAGLTFVLHSQSLIGVAAWCILLLVLSAKARLEERYLRQKFSEYAHYQQRVNNRFWPGFFLNKKNP